MAAALLIATAAVHSLLGERLLIAPLLARGEGILAGKLARFVLRFAWHLTSLSWAVLALILIQLVHDPVSARWWAAASTGAAFTGAGLFDLIYSRGRHLGWPLLTGVGVAAFLSLAL
jgi:hypothetical protein